jgi:hypothetical protein
LPALKDPREETTLVRVEPSSQIRRPVNVSLGCHVPTAAMPHPDLRDTATTLGGIVKRVASKHPTPEPELLERLKMHVRQWLKENLQPLASDTDLSIERWLAHTNYPEWRKRELLDKWYSIDDRRHKKYNKVSAFIKDEPYPEYKHARGIYSRSDIFKMRVGPYFKWIEEQVYRHPAFVKHVPVKDRPRYIAELLGVDDGELADNTDYSAFESQFCKEIMSIVEIELYDYMTLYLPTRQEFLEDLGVICGKQEIDFRHVGLVLGCARMSGEMCTSLGNGFSNLMFADFLAKEKGCTNLRIAVEGDDGLMKYSGPRLSAEDFARLGLTIKLEQHADIRKASFCGIIFDDQELINIDDPREVLASFGWGGAQYTRSSAKKKLRLLRCKALSLAHQYPGCPIIGELAHYGLRVTRGMNIGNLGCNARNQWYREQLLAAIKDQKNIQYREPGPRSRALVSEVYGISVEQQLSIEAYLRSLNTAVPLSHGTIDDIMPDTWKHFTGEYQRYVLPGAEAMEDFSCKGGDPVKELLDSVRINARMTATWPGWQPIVQDRKGDHSGVPVRGKVKRD